MPRAERARQVAELRAEGLSINEIAARLGIARSTANQYVIDPDGLKDKARKARYAGSCMECGGPTTGSNGPDLAPSVCKWCKQGVPMNDRRRPSQPSLRRCVPIVLSEIPINVRVQAAIDANKHERFPEQRNANISAALWPDDSLVYWVAEGGQEILAAYIASAEKRRAA